MDRLIIQGEGRKGKGGEIGDNLYSKKWAGKASLFDVFDVISLIILSHGISRISSIDKAMQIADYLIMLSMTIQLSMFIDHF